MQADATVSLLFIYLFIKNFALSVAIGDIVNRVKFQQR